MGAQISYTTSRDLTRGRVGQQGAERGVADTVDNEAARVAFSAGGDVQLMDVKVAAMRWLAERTRQRAFCCPAPDVARRWRATRQR